MKSQIAVLLATLAVVCAELHPLSDEFIAEINEKATTWVAERQFDISEWERVQKIVNGVIRRPRTEAENAELERRIPKLSESDIPESFDSAEKWPNCESIREIRDQSRCGSCWAFAAVEAMSDRICIHSNQKLQTRVSSQDLTTCCKSCGSGCHGGFPEEAWQYWIETGIVTGGLHNNTQQGCQAYFLPECEDHLHNCEDYVNTPACSRKCDDPSVSFSQSKTYGQNLIVRRGVAQIQAEILANGPVETAFSVPADFVNYKFGIYQPTTDRIIGGHAVKFVGWGVENGVKYWKVANSWNTRWGENGYFRIVRGENIGGIEDEAVAAMPVLK